MPDDKIMSFMEHLDELRKRLIYSFYALLVGFGVAYAFSEFLFAWLAQPLIRAWKLAGINQPQLHFSNPIEPFFTFLKLALVVGIFVASPFIFYQLWKFVAPGLYKNEKRYALPFAIASGIFFIGGAAFGYFMVFPYGFRFFLGYATTDIGVIQKVFGHKVNVSVAAPIKLTPTLMMGEYFSLVWQLLFAFGVVFELPLVLTFLSMAGLVSAKALWRFNRYFMVLAFVIGAVLTPPDVITQVFMSLPLIVLYNLSILMAFLIERKKKHRREEEVRDESTL